MRRLDGWLRTAAIALSALAHAGVIWWVADDVLRTPAKAPVKAELTQVTLSFPPQPPEPEPLPEVTPPEPEPPPPEPPKPEPKSTPKPTPTPKPKPKPKPQPTPPPPPVSQPVTAPVVAEKAEPAPPDPELLRRIREQYLNRLLAHIEAHKFYPTTARRRRLEGEIQVSFTLGEGGRITNLAVSGGHPLLQKAAEEAVLKAEPMPKPPAEVPCPLPVRYAMAYDLK